MTGFEYPAPMRVRGVLAALILAIGPGGVAAAQDEVPGESVPRPLWEAGVAVGAVSAQTYAGADRRELYWAAAPYIVYRGRHVRAAGRSVRLVLYERPGFWTDLSGGGWLPVDTGDNPVRAGMPDLDFTLQAGPRVNYLVRGSRAGDTILRLAVRGVWSVDGVDEISHRGFIAQPAVRVGVRPGGPDARLSAAVTLSTLWGDAEHNGYFYNVEAPYVTPERPAYRSGPGLVWTAVGMSVGWRFTPRLRLSLSVDFKTLAGSVVEDSPLVTDRNAVTVGAGLVWVFKQSARTVAGRPAEGG